ncbi:glycerophosphodiester phosphodiesterase [Pollutimonas subterranea]|uniref:Glycerophosphodiester phosphodiesterase n=1 Tax=Pollutimonas subterranea TaxID=2045210 RepID=A0A2N4U7Y0_9BURK|nr:glycerophosphodiester phosphodiesterase [Pollutimonas subterranea]PLC51124.1 glycerophosphodiester phosphodiesterase [Pollutimonas subterranea]
MPPNWPYPKLIAHRGAGLHAPENTLAAIRLGARHGFTMMEYDVKLSRDGVAVLLHDDTVDRTSNGCGRAGDMTLKELAELDFGSWSANEYAGESIPTLASIASYTRANGIRSNIEIKPTTGSEAETGQQVARLAQRLWTGADVPPLLSSFSEVALAAAMKEAPLLPRALLIEDEIPEDWEDRIKRLGCAGLNLNHKYTTLPLVQALRTRGYTVAVWTVNDMARAQELLEWGCNAVVTDEITHITPATLP